MTTPQPPPTQIAGLDKLGTLELVHRYGEVCRQTTLASQMPRAGQMAGALFELISERINRDGGTTEPAVVFDEAAFSLWWDSDAASNSFLSTTYGDDIDHTPARWTDWLLQCTLGKDRPSWWRTGPGVGEVQIWRTGDDDGVDGGGVLLFDVDGVPLGADIRAGNLIYGDLDPGGWLAMPGDDASVLALQQVAAAVNAAAAKLRRHRHNPTGTDPTEPKG